MTLTAATAVDTAQHMLKTLLIVLALVSVGPAYAAPPNDAVALVGGKQIAEKDLDLRAAPQLRELNAKIFEVRERALNEMIDEQLLNQEASRLKLSVRQILDREVDSKVAKPNSSEVEAYYREIKDRVGRPFEEMRPQISEYLAATRRRAAYENYLTPLRDREKVVVLLAPPRTEVSIDSTRVRGPLDAPITIVEFSDFECPYCGRVEDTLRQLMSRFPTQIRLAYRDFPLAFHPRARPAAEASRCALAQGEYWPYHDLLFQNQQHLDSGDLSKYAVRLKLDSKRFDECIARRDYAAEVQHDLDEGNEIGVTGTPAFFINGIVITGATPLDEFTRLIDQELARVQREH